MIFPFLEFYTLSGVDTDLIGMLDTNHFRYQVGHFQQLFVGVASRQDQFDINWFVLYQVYNVI